MNLVEMAEELLEIESDWQRYGFAKENYELMTFKQIWSDTSGGFQSTIAQDALVTQRTYVLFSYDKVMPHFVYFDGKYAYNVAYGDETFENDVEENHVAGRKDAVDRYKLV